MKKTLGDFQTPPYLVKLILQRLDISGQNYSRVLEPACGRGNFIQGLLGLEKPPQEIQGIELQSSYINELEHIKNCCSTTRIQIHHQQLFNFDLKRDLQWQTAGKLLVIGNPPWINIAQLSRENSNNVPQKSNLKNLKGLEAITGSSNFDLTEYIWLKILQELASEEITIALLCKLSVARKVLEFASDRQLPVIAASLWEIDAKKSFGVSVGAGLFKLCLGQGKVQYNVPVYRSLEATKPYTEMGIVNQRVVSNINSYYKFAFADGECPLIWRQGVKHDAASVMELNYNEDGSLYNKVGELVTVEADYIYPLYKSTQLFKQKEVTTEKAVILTQQFLGEDTLKLKQIAPQLWRYLTQHKTIFDNRKSSIYRNQPLFAIFGIGEYTFSAYKVAISGLHKNPRFRALGLVNNRPIVLDDTCYFIPCDSPEQAAFLTCLLNHPLSLELIQSWLFPDAKRPITKKLLKRLDFTALLTQINWRSLLPYAEIEFANIASSDQQPNWPSDPSLFWQKPAKYRQLYLSL